VGRVAQSLVFVVVFLDHCLSFLISPLSVLRFTASDYLLRSFKLFL